MLIFENLYIDVKKRNIIVWNNTNYDWFKKIKIISFWIFNLTISSIGLWHSRKYVFAFFVIMIIISFFRLFKITEIYFRARISFNNINLLKYCQDMKYNYLEIDFKNKKSKRIPTDLSEFDLEN